MESSVRQSQHRSHSARQKAVLAAFFDETVRPILCRVIYSWRGFLSAESHDERWQYIASWFNRNRTALRQRRIQSVKNLFVNHLMNSQDTSVDESTVLNALQTAIPSALLRNPVRRQLKQLLASSHGKHQFPSLSTPSRMAHQTPPVVISDTPAAGSFSSSILSHPPKIHGISVRQPLPPTPQQRLLYLLNNAETKSSPSYPNNLQSGVNYLQTNIKKRLASTSREEREKHRSTPRGILWYDNLLVWDLCLYAAERTVGHSRQNLTALRTALDEFLKKFVPDDAAKEFYYNCRQLGFRLIEDMIASPERWLPIHHKFDQRITALQSQLSTRQKAILEDLRKFEILLYRSSIIGEH